MVRKRTATDARMIKKPTGIQEKFTFDGHSGFVYRTRMFTNFRARAWVTVSGHDHHTP
jgi:hypothetical protein